MLDKVKLTGEELSIMSFFESSTGISPVDCVVTDEGVLIKKRIQVVKYLPAPERFLRSFLSLGPKDVVRIVKRKDGESYAIIEVNPARKGLVIGRGGRKIKQARFLVSRYFGLRTVLVR